MGIFENIKRVGNNYQTWSSHNYLDRGGAEGLGVYARESGSSIQPLPRNGVVYGFSKSLGVA